LAQRLQLEAQLRDLQLRLDNLSIFPAVGTIVGGGISIGIGITLYFVTVGQCTSIPGVQDCSQNNTDALIFSMLAIVPGAIAALLGTLELVSITNRQNELQSQINQVKQSLAQLSAAQAQAAGVVPPHAPPGLITLRF
jgi:hypothetical protein